MMTMPLSPHRAQALRLSRKRHVSGDIACQFMGLNTLVVGELLIPPTDTLPPMDCVFQKLSAIKFFEGHPDPLNYPW